VIFKLKEIFYQTYFKQVTIQTPLSCENIYFSWYQTSASKKPTHPTMQEEKDSEEKSQHKHPTV